MPQFSDFSRFRQTQLVNYQGISTLDKWAQPTWLSQKLTTDKEGTFYVTSEYEGKADMIANLIYGTPLLDWVIISYNNAEPFGWPKTGSIIKYPSERVVFPELLG
jgi:hypothetical protein